MVKGLMVKGLMQRYKKSVIVTQKIKENSCGMFVNLPNKNM